MSEVIYLDNNSTTAVNPGVVKAMGKVGYGNPSSSHDLGEEALKSMNDAGDVLAREIGCKAWELVFTSGATEANNLAVFGVARSGKKKKIIISAIEHASVYEPCMALKKEGFQIVEIRVGKNGILDMEKLEKEIDSKTGLVSIIHGHNEIGVLQDIGKIGKICKRKGVLFHTDAVQSFGKEKIDVRKMGIDLLSASAHKIGGPKGSGFLYVKEGIKLKPLIYGGGQERGLRGGTENVSGIVGFAEALKEIKKVNWDKVSRVRDYLISGLEKIGGKINGSVDRRLAGNVNVSFPGKNSEMLVISLSQKGIMCSARSACSEKDKKENRILKALGISEKDRKGTLRFGLNEKIGKREIDIILKHLE